VQEVPSPVQATVLELVLELASVHALVLVLDIVVAVDLLAYQCPSSSFPSLRPLLPLHRLDSTGSTR